MTAVARPMIGNSRWRESATLLRQSPGYRARGKWQPGVATATDINVVSAPPASAAARDILPEGARLQDWRVFWLDVPAEPLRVGDGQTDGDVVLYQGVRYRLRHVNDWTPHGFVETLGVREEGQ